LTGYSCTDFFREKNVQKLDSLVTPLIELCRLAGNAISTHYHSSSAAEYQAKDDQSPLTRADTLSHSILVQGLNDIADDIPILSEESDPIDVAERLSWQRYWLVDPLDGTKEFLARTGEFTINIALIDDHAPVLGVLYVPLTEQAYVGIPGVSARGYQHLGDGEWSARELCAQSLAGKKSITVLASRRHGGEKLEDCFAWLSQHWGATERVNSGSAIKFCQMVDGRGDFYPRFSPSCEWDTAAGQALLEAVGGCVLGMNGKSLRYNEGESLLSPDYYAIADGQDPFWQGLFARPATSSFL
jgi:3'(2'), 5'-bisphosphate nucleotidase